MITFFTLTFGSIVVLWGCFYLMFNRMPEYTVAGKRPWYWWLVAVPGVVVDLFVNFYIGTIIFLQLPDLNRGFLSARMDYLILHDFGWRGRLAIKIVGALLEPYDKTKQHSTYGRYSA